MAKPASPVDIAREMGLDFTVEEPAASSIPVLRFTFAFPEVTQPLSDEYRETVSKVTAWSKRVAPWTFLPTGNVVCAELTFGNRVRVTFLNRKNRKALEVFHSAEAQARRLALSQPTPEQSLSMLKAEEAKHQTEFKTKETRQLRKAFVRAARLLEEERAQSPVIPMNPHAVESEAMH